MLVRSARSVAIAGLSCAATWWAGGGCGPGRAGPHDGGVHAAKPAASNTNDERLAEFFMGVLLGRSRRFPVACGGLLRRVGIADGDGEVAAAFRRARRGHLADRIRNLLAVFGEIRPERDRPAGKHQEQE